MIYVVGARVKTEMARPKHAKEEEMTTPTAIDEAEEEMVAKVARFAVQLII